MHYLFFLSIIFSNSDSLKQMRRFGLKMLTDFKMGKKLSEEIIIEECNLPLEAFELFEDNILCS